MDGQTPQTDTSFISIVRDHSPYCEASRPIVQQGYVAARVRAIQGRYDPAQRKIYCSSMTPRPVAKGLLVNSLHASPKSSLASRLAKTNRTDADAAELSVSRADRMMVKSAPSDNIVASHTTKTAAGSYRTDKAHEDTTKILSAQAIPSALTKLSEHWASSCHEEEDPCDHTQEVPISCPRRSVAAKLGSVVGQGWVGCDNSRKVDNDQRPPSACTPPLLNDSRVVSKDQVQSPGSHAEDLSPGQNMNAEAKLHSHSVFQTSEDRKCATSEHSHPTGVPHSTQSKEGFGKKSDHHTNMHTNKCSSAGFEEESQDEKLPTPENGDEAEALHNLDCSNDCMNYETKPQEVSFTRGNYRHLSQGKHAGGDEQALQLEQNTPSKSLANDDHKAQPDLQGHSEKPDYPSPVSSTESSSFSRTSTVQQSKQSATRSISWFAKLAGYKLVLLDKTPVNQDTSRRTSEPCMNTGQHQRYQVHRPRPLTPIEAEAEAVCGSSKSCEQQLQDEKKIVRASSTEPMLEDEVSRQEERDGEQLGDFPTSDETLLAAGTQRHGSGTSVEANTSRSQLTPSSETPKRQRSIRLSYGENDMSTPSPETCQASNIARNASRTSYVRDSSQEMPSYPTRAHFPKEGSRESLPQTSGPETESHSLGTQTPPNPYRTGERHEERPQSIHWRAAGRGRGIKRVQVIVSLDGADDLVVEAKLRKGHGRENSVMPVEQIQAWHAGEVSNSFAQVLPRIADTWG